MRTGYIRAILYNRDNLLYYFKSKYSNDNKDLNFKLKNKNKNMVGIIIILL